MKPALLPTTKGEIKSLMIVKTPPRRPLKDQVLTAVIAMLLTAMCRQTLRPILLLTTTTNRLTTLDNK